MCAHVGEGLTLPAINNSASRVGTTSGFWRDGQIPRTRRNCSLGDGPPHQLRVMTDAMSIIVGEMRGT